MMRGCQGSVTQTTTETNAKGRERGAGWLLRPESQIQCTVRAYDGRVSLLSLLLITSLLRPTAPISAFMTHTQLRASHTPYTDNTALAIVSPLSIATHCSMRCPTSPYIQPQ